MHQPRSVRAVLATLVAICLGLTIALVGPQTASAAPNATIHMTRTDGLGDRVKVGDTLTFQVQYTNTGDQTVTVYPRSSNLTQVLPPNAPNCRWMSLAPGATSGVCSSAKYTVTSADASAGTFTPSITFDLTSDTGGTNVVKGGIVKTTSPVTVTTQDVQRYLTVSMTRTDTVGPQARIGDRLTFNVTYKNTSSQAVTAFPRSSNLSATLPTSAPNCRYVNLPAGATQTCTSAFYTVTEADVAAGSITPFVRFDVTSDANGATVLHPGIVASTSAIAISSELAEDPATIPTDRADGEYVTLAKSGDLGFACHRIPALTQANNGWILAAWDGRPGGCADAPNPNSIVQRISKDGGKSWERGKVIAAGQPAAPKYGYSDPSYVVDRETGHVFAFFLKSYDQGFFGSQAGTDPTDRNVQHAAFIKSTDNGTTWSAPQIITAAITPDPSWISRFAASGEGIQLRYGAYAGRLIQQYSIKLSNGTIQAVSVYSDDNGATWQAGNPVGTGMDENKTVELSDGRVMLNSRAPGTGARRITISNDGGVNYGPTYMDNSLIDPTNNASITRAYPNAPQGSAQAKMLLFSNAAATSRSNGTVKLSYNDGATWSVAKVFQPGFMAYSTLTPLGYGGVGQAGQYGLLYEGANYAEIRYMRVSLDWLGASSAGEAATIHMTRTDGLGDRVKVGDTLTFRLQYTNTSNQTLTVFPRSSNLTQVLPPNAPNCRWGNLAPGATSGACTSAKYTVTAADASAGTFTPRVTFDLTSDTAGTNVIQAGIVRTTSPVAVTTQDVQKYLNVSMTRTDANGATVQAGDQLTFNITYANTSGQAVTAFPRSSNLSSTLTTGTPNCRYGSLGAGASHTCTSAYYTVTPADVAAGSFVPVVRFDATSDTGGSNVLHPGIVASLAAIPVQG